MQKKLLACLLVAPVAGTALANVEIPQTQFPADKAQSVSGTDFGFKFNFMDGEGLFAPIGAGIVTFQSIELCPGTYNVNIQNAQNLKVTVAGESVEIAEGDGTLSFTLTATTEVAVEMSAINLDKEFRCGAAALQIEINEAEVNAALQELLKTAVPDGILPLREDVADETLIKTFGELTEKYGQIVEQISKVTEPLSLEDYKAFELWKSPAECTIGVAISELAAPVATYNEEAKAANEAAAKLDAQTQAYIRLMRQVNAYQGKLKEVTDKAEAADKGDDAKFVSTQIKEAVAAFQNHINALKEAVEDQKDNLTIGANGAPEGLVYPEGTDYSSMMNEWKALNAACDNAIADKDAWVKYQAAIEKLTKVYNETYTLVNSLQDIDGKDGDVFGSARATCLEGLTDLLNKNNNSDGKFILGSPADELTAATEALPAVESEMKLLYDKFKSTVDSQNEAYKAAQEEITAFEKAFKEAAGEATAVPDAQKAEYDRLVKAVNDALDAFKNYVDGQYAANTLFGDEYTEKAEAVDEAIKALKLATDNYGPLFELQKDLIAAEDKVKEISDALTEWNEKENPGFSMDLYAKFKGQIDGLKAALGALTPGVSSEAEIEAVKKAIASMTETAQKLSDAYKSAATGYVEFNASLADYKEFVDAKLIIEGADYEKTDENTGLGALNALLAEYQEALTNIGVLDSQSSYDAAVALANKMTEDDWSTQLTTAKETFAKAATDANQAFATKLVREDAKKLLEDNKNIGNLEAKAPYKGLEDMLTAARAHVSMAGTDTSKLGECDIELQKVVDAYNTFTGDVKAYIAFIEQIKDVPETIAEAYEFNQNTIDPAKSYFNGLLDATTGEYITRYNELIAALDKALSEGTLVAGKEGEKGFDATANALVTEVNGAQKRIEINQAAYDELLNKSKNVLGHIDGVIKYFETNCQDQAELEKYLDALKELKSKDLAGVDVAMTGDFGKGALNDAKKGEYFTQYDNISAKADELLKTFDAGVADLNAGTAGNWTATIADLRSLKDQAVRVYNAFFYDITNKGYREYIHADLLTHQGLYDFTQKITKLEGDIQNFIDQSNTDKVAFSKAQFDEVATTPMADMAAAINADKDKLIADMNRLGAAYWAEQSDYRGGVYTSLVQSMTAAGMFKTENGAVVTEDERPVLNDYLFGKCPALVEAIDSYFDAVTKHKSVENAASEEPKPEGYGYKDQIGYAMNGIANLLDKVVYNEAELEAAADILWDALYKAFSDKAAEDLASVDTAEEYSFATAEQKDAAKEAINGVIEEGVEYNAQATDAEANTLAVLQDGGADALDKLAEKIQAALEELQKQSDAKKAADELYNEYTGADNGIIPGLEDELQKLKDYAASLAADSKSETVSAIAGAKTAIDSLSKFVEENKSDLAAEGPKTHAEELKADATAAIEAAYTAVREAETSLLNNIMVSVREAFNNAKAETSWSNEDAAAMQAKIDAAIEAIAGLDKLTNEEFQTTAQGLEKDLCDYLAELEAVYTHEGTNTAAVDAQARLTAQYEAVEAALEAAKAELAKCEPSVQEAFANAYTPSEEALAAALAAYSNAGNQVVALEGNYAAQLTAVQQMIEKTQAEVEAANQAALAQAAIDAHAAELQEKIDGFTQQLEEIRTYLSTYMLDRPDQLGSDISSIERMIAQMQTILNTMVEEKTLTADTEIPTAKMIETQLTNLNYFGHVSAVDYVNHLAETAVSEARTNLSRAHLLAETRTQLNDQLTAAEQLRLNAMQALSEAMETYESSAQTAEDLAAFIEATDKAITDLTKAENDARAVSEGVYDNEFTPGDVDLEPNGVVSVVDVQQVITWIGQGMTYQELAETSPRQAYAADVNGDKVLNIADAVAILNIAMEDLNNPTAAPRMLAKGIQEAPDNHIALALNGTENGLREYAVLISNTTSFVAGQLDLKVGAGMEIVDIELTDRATDHELYRFDNSNGARVIVASMSNAALEGNDGALLIVRTRGAGNLEIEGAVFSDSNATGYGLNALGLSGIDSITEGCQNVKERIYNVAGQTMQRIQRGINIIRKSDGTTTKEMH